MKKRFIEIIESWQFKLFCVAILWCLYGIFAFGYCQPEIKAAYEAAVAAADPAVMGSVFLSAAVFCLFFTIPLTFDLIDQLVAWLFRKKRKEVNPDD